MRRLAHSKVLVELLAALALLPAGAPLTFLPAAAAQDVTCQDGRCVKMLYGNAPVARRLRINGHGPVTLLAGTTTDLTYVVQVSVKARTESEGRRALANYAVRVTNQGGWAVLTMPGGTAMSTVTVRSPRLVEAAVSTSDGAVEATGIEGPLNVDTGGGDLTCDRVRGECKLVSGGGDIHVGRVYGALRCSTEGGHITVAAAGGDTFLQTKGGDIVAGRVGGPVHAETGGGSVQVDDAGGSVTAISGGGQIRVGKANGLVTIQNMAGPVQVGSAAGVRCESGSGVVRVTNIWGPMSVSTAMGSIFASLIAGKLADSFLATGNGDITVTIPSNVGVTIRAENRISDIRRIISEFPGLPVRMVGTRVVAEGPVNGGGPLLGLTGTGGTIFIRKQ
jgi:DUF4097 and DUF4098 domain-containing protein YvlB